MRLLLLAALFLASVWATVVALAVIRETRVISRHERGEGSRSNARATRREALPAPVS